MSEPLPGAASDNTHTHIHKFMEMHTPRHTSKPPLHTPTHAHAQWCMLTYSLSLQVLSVPFISIESFLFVPPRLSLAAFLPLCHIYGEQLCLLIPTHILEMHVSTHIKTNKYTRHANVSGGQTFLVLKCALITLNFIY